jgi:hypothetical protein
MRPDWHAIFRYEPDGKLAYIYVNYKKINLGTFDTAEEAYEARKLAELNYYGSKLMVAQ